MSCEPLPDPAKLLDAVELMLDDIGNDPESHQRDLVGAVRGVGYALVAIGRKMPDASADKQPRRDPSAMQQVRDLAMRTGILPKGYELYSPSTSRHSESGKMIGAATVKAAGHLPDGRTQVTLILEADEIMPTGRRVEVWAP